MNQQTKNIPTLRFPEFVGDWKNKKLGEYLTFKNGINADKAQYGQGLKFINVLDIINNNTITYDKIIGRVDVSENELKKNEVKYGDILFQRSSETREEVGQSNVYVDRTKTATFGGFVIRGQAIQEYNPLFFHYLLKTSSAREEITTKSGGSTRYNIGQETLKEVKITIPEIPEQEKISTFLMKIGEKIQQLTKKKILLKQYKKGVLQQIFNQEIRFKNNDGNNFEDWEEKKVEDIFEVTRGNVLAMSQVLSEKNAKFMFPVYSSQTRNNGLSGYYKDYLFEDCITWTTDGAGAGDVNFRRGKFYCTNVCGVLKSNEGYANNFISELLNTVSRKHVSYIGNPKLMNNVMSKIKIFIPKSIEEQTKIADFLSAIDDKIHLVKKQLEKTQTFKKGLLQQMFI